MATRTARTVASSASRTPALRKAAAAPPAAAGIARLQLLPARAGDHPSIHAFLLSIFQGPTAAEFHAQLDEPGYLPSDRLLIKRGDELAAHLRLARQAIHVGRALLPAARFMDLATAPQLRGRGVATALVAAGERVAAQRGVVVGLTRTRFPSLFARHGWSASGGQVHSTASPRAVLAELAAQRMHRLRQESAGSLFSLPAAELIVRPLRRVELTAIVRLYRQRAQTHVGWPVRDEAYWDWLLARGAYDRIYVAAQAAPSASLAATIDSVVGYACVRQSRIVELVAAADQPRAAELLLERICADARELDGWSVRYDAPPGDPLHRLLVQAGGQLAGVADAREVSMVKVFDPLAALRLIVAELRARGNQCGLPLPAELGLDLRSRDASCRGSKRSGIVERLQLRFRKGAAAVATGGPSRHVLSLAQVDLAPLLVGCRSAAELLAEGRLVASSAKARSLAMGLFPGGQWWRPVFDDLLA